MNQQTRHPLRDAREQQLPSRQGTQKPADSVDGTRLTHPIDGSQYLDVVEEQEYADRRPTAEEQKPRFSYLHHKEEEQQEDDGQTE